VHPRVLSLRTTCLGGRQPPVASSNQHPASRITHRIAELQSPLWAIYPAICRSHLVTLSERLDVASILSLDSDFDILPAFSVR